MRRLAKGSSSGRIRNYIYLQVSVLILSFGMVSVIVLSTNIKTVEKNL